MDVVEQTERPPDDGRTIDAETAAEVGVEAIQILPVSHLPEGQQFTVLSGWLKADADHSKEWRDEANNCFAFRAGDQWTPQDKAMLEGQRRPVIVFNRVLTILKAVAGMEINGRHETQYIPRGTEDTAVNEVLTSASKWMADSCDGEDEESQAFDHTATCGMGCCEERMSYEDDAAGLYIEECVDPREMYWDRTAKKKNLSDARRMARVRRMPISEAVALFPGKTKDQLDAAWAEDVGGHANKSIEDKRRRDSEDMTELSYDDQCEVTIVQIQWIERETYYVVADPATNTRSELTEPQFRTLEQRMKQLNMEITAVRLTRKVYKQAFLGSEILKKAKAAPIKGQFSWKFITGEFDAVKGTWFGLVKVLRDPQMWANKWLAQILHILNTTAKGGILAETSAFDDQREAEDGYAQPDVITWLADGALSGDKPKIMPKPGTGMTEAFVGLLTFAISSFKDVSGINLELLGQQDQNQPGIIEAMRKQAGMTVLATLFDSLRRFRKQIGRGRLFFIQNFLSDERLIRVVGADEIKAVKLSKEVTTGLYDVIVDDTPTSPNQKEANWQIIQPLLVVFKDQLMANPQVLGMLLEYSPLPSRIVEAVKNFIKQQTENPKAAQEQQENRQILVRGAIARISKDEAAARLSDAKVGTEAVRAQTEQASAIHAIAMARNLLEDNQFSAVRNEIEAIEAKAKAILAESQARHSEVSIQREIAGMRTDAMDAETRRIEATNDVSKSGVGMLIDQLAATASIDKDLAGAEKDRATARKIDREPVRPAAR